MVEKNFVGYDYKTLTTTRDLEPVYTDSMPSFGWEFEGRSPALAGTQGVTLRFKRDRKIRNKAELNRLERQFEAGVEEIGHLERSKVIGASAVAYLIGILGTAFMAGSVFAYLAGLIPLSILLAIPGFAGWVIPYLSYVKLRKDKTVKVEPAIDKQYDAIYRVCEKAGGLLGRETL